MTYPVITIDGPSGAGKGTLAYRLAKHFGFNLLDSGALYRIAGLCAYQAQILTDDMLTNGLPNTDIADIEAKVANLTINLNIDFVINDSTQMVQIILNNKPLCDDIRNEKVGKMASLIATLPKVRQALLGVQQDTKQRNGVVADGRDMGTVIFPKATAKIFLTASSQSRASRRVNQLTNMGKPADYQTILADIQKRDEQDQNRAISPSKPATDALVIDSSTLSADEVFKISVDYCTKCGVRQNVS